jgi:transposase
MEQRTLMPDAGEVALDQLRVEGRNQLLVVLRPAGEESICPACRQVSRRIHCRYSRRLSDLPWEMIPVQIELRVPRFFCSNQVCGQHICAEWLPKTVRRYGRCTFRLSVAFVGTLATRPQLGAL